MTAPARERTALIVTPANGYAEASFVRCETARDLRAVWVRRIIAIDAAGDDRQKGKLRPAVEEACQAYYFHFHDCPICRAKTLPPWVGEGCTTEKG